MKLTLAKKVEEARGTTSFFWQPEKEVTYKPGQYFYFTISKLNYPDERGTTRHFTLSSSPTEGQLLRNTTRIREESGFKKTMNELPVGSVIDGEGPNGVFIFDEKEPGPHIFVAGGIGITPFRSMIKYVADKNLTNQIYLIYSNSDNDFVFKKELDELAAAHPNVKIRYFVTSTEGHLDDVKIKGLVADWKLEIGNCTFWIVGPPPMVDAMETAMAKLAIGGDHVRTEKFTGY